jgi:anthranilate/para-aminobenzoate synthase component II
VILLIDNYDSFVHNLARYLRELGEETEIVRNDAIDVEGVARLRPSHVVISPGPCTPDEAGVSVELIRALGARIPVLTSLVRHVGEGVFAGLPNPLQATRYHSLVVSPDALPADLAVTAYSDEGEIMALAHRTHPVVGVQFHPEAVLTAHGHDLLRNFLRAAARADRQPVNGRA